MKYAIEFDLPDNKTIEEELKYVSWSIWGYSGIAKAKSVEGPKKGRWIFSRYFVWECSECGKSPTKGMGYVQNKSELFNYCPNCGAKMEVTE